MDDLKLLFEEVNDETLARITTAVAAGLAATAVGHHIYKKYKEKKLLKKYGSDTQEEQEKKVDPVDAGWNALDAYASRSFAPRK